jgi:predicted GNAT family acetyltransferase
VSVVNNEARNRFELEENGELAFANYRRNGDVFTIPHVEAAMALRGKGSASRLMEGIVVIARENHYKIHPTCSSAMAWFRRHPEQSDLVV